MHGTILHRVYTVYIYCLDLQCQWCGRRPCWSIFHKRISLTSFEFGTNMACHAIVFYNYQGIDCKSRIGTVYILLLTIRQRFRTFIFFLMHRHVYVANAPFKIFNEHYNDLIFTFLEISNTLMMFSYIYARNVENASGSFRSPLPNQRQSHKNA
jgi:hypothetical protein